MRIAFSFAVKRVTSEGKYHRGRIAPIRSLKSWHPIAKMARGEKEVSRHFPYIRKVPIYTYRIGPLNFRGILSPSSNPSEDTDRYTFR